MFEGRTTKIEKVTFSNCPNCVPKKVIFLKIYTLHFKI